MKTQTVVFLLSVRFTCGTTLSLTGCDSGQEANAAENNAVALAQKADIAEEKAEILEDKAASASNKSPPPDQIITKAEIQAVDPSGEKPLDEAIVCLSRTIYWEAKGEGAAGMEAIANVVLNRLSDAGFPKTICGVVKQGVEHGSCQFSWWCDGRSDHVQEEKSYAISKEITRRALNGQLADRTGGALYFHHRRLAPDWSLKFKKTAKIGDHVFYKP